MPVISSNVAANTALSFLDRSFKDQQDSLARISSGQRIVRPADDASGLAVGTALLSDVSVFKQAAINTSTSQSILSVADGGLSSAGDILERQAVLAAQASSATVTNAERVAINEEYQQLSSELDSIGVSTNFNGQSLLDGSFNQNVVVGPESGDTIALDLSAVDVSTAGLGTAGTDLLNGANASLALDAVNGALGTLSNYRAGVGALESRFGFRGEYIAQAQANTEAVASSILDVNLAEEQTRLTNSRVLTEAGIASLSQANQITQSLLNLVR